MEKQKDVADAPVAPEMPTLPADAVRTLFSEAGLLVEGMEDQAELLMKNMFKLLVKQQQQGSQGPSNAIVEASGGDGQLNSSFDFGEVYDDGEVYDEKDGDSADEEPSRRVLRKKREGE